jgi:flavodoxin I
MTADIASRIQERIGPDRADLWDVEDSSPDDMLGYEILILGIPTWGIGRVQEDWKNFISRLKDVNLSGKKVALFGLGDQESYPGTFADAMGKLYRSISKTGCSFIGSWPVEGYVYERSEAVMGERFVGLVIDEDNQPELTDERLEQWLKEIWED